ncbi:hypothetical protein GIB67_040640 [Kingdonia uniflora]|uniref:Uncharacterized protein n=1 Tax=Kingdonia uniflora TaxID=39325 RepID=A0A7J7M901_9MAGN|nr:hypothetical protein GIB67_040640 [Kingdonia uniflora]
MYPPDRSLLLGFKFYRARSIYLGLLPGIPEQQHSDVAEYCTRWKWGLSITNQTGAHDLLKYRKAFDNYKVEDVVRDPYRAERRSDHNFNENTFFNGLASCPVRKTTLSTQHLSLNVLVAFGQLAVIPKGEAVHSRDLQKKIDELTVIYEDAAKMLKEK